MIGTNTEEEYVRPLEIGELLTGTLSLLEVSEQKTTGLGTGYFVTTLTEYTNQKGERIGSWKFRTFNCRPHQPSEEELAEKKWRQEQQVRIPKSLLVRPRPAVMKETAFFWEGAKAGELRIQEYEPEEARLAAGEVRHAPPGLSTIPSDRLVLCRPTDGGPFLISERSERELVARLLPRFVLVLATGSALLLWGAWQLARFLGGA